MAHPTWTEKDTARALVIWAEYQSSHDIGDRIGQAVGIDPMGGRLWFGGSATEIARKRDAEGINAPLYVLRVDRDYYLRKCYLRKSGRR